MSKSASDIRRRAGDVSDARRASGGPTGKGRTRGWVWLVLIVALALAGLAVIFSTSSNRSSGPAGTAGGGTDSKYPYAVGSPGPGAQAVDFELPSTDGDTLSLESYRGDTVLLYFQEGLMCQPCWDQMRDIERRWADVSAAGIDSMLTITTDPINALRDKVALEGLEYPVLSDADLTVSRAYDTNSYGMMGDSRNGHTFIVVGPDGKIRWRADYGGAPNYTMYVPAAELFDDLQAGLSTRGPSGS